MSHLDTLKIYKEHLAAGFTEQEAVAATKALDSAFDGLDSVRKAELDYSIQSIRTDFAHAFDLLRKDFAGIKWMVFGMGALFAVPIIQQIWSAFKA